MHHPRWRRLRYEERTSDTFLTIRSESRADIGEVEHWRLLTDTQPPDNEKPCRGQGPRSNGVGWHNSPKVLPTSEGGRSAALLPGHFYLGTRISFGREVLPTKLPSPPYEPVTVYGEPLNTSADVTVHVAWPPDSVTVSPPSQSTVEPPAPVMTKVTAPVGIPDAPRDTPHRGSDRRRTARLERGADASA